MTDHKALIAEAMKQADRLAEKGVNGTPNLLRFLAAALEEATPPEGWWISAYERQDATCIEYDGVVHWVITDATGTTTVPTYATARAAMEALEGGGNG